MPLFGPPDARKLEAKKDVKGLIKALRYKKKPSVQAAAALALGRIGDARAVEPLIAALKDPSFSVRRCAAKALGEIGDSRAVEPLSVALEDHRFGREAVAEVLETLGWQPEKSEAGAIYWIQKRRWDKCVEIGSPAVELLIAALKDKDTDVRAAAAEALGQIGDARAVEPLIAALKDKDTDVRAAAAEALGRIGDARAVEPLIAALKDKDTDVRAAAAEALGRIGDAGAVEPLVAALKDVDPSVRTSAAEVLDQLGWKPDRSETGAWYWIAKRDWDKPVEIGAPAVDPLIATLKSKYNVRWNATKALVEIGAPAVEPLIAALKYKDVRAAAAEALGDIGDARAVEPLIAALKDEDGGVRVRAATALGRIGDAGAVEPLVAALKDVDPSVCTSAAEVLDQLGWKPDRSETGAWYWIAKRDPRKSVEIGAPAVEPLIATLKDEYYKERCESAMALGDIGDVRAVEPLVTALGDKSGMVRTAAALALGDIGDVRAVEPLIAELKDCERNEFTPYAAALSDIGDARAVKLLIAALKDSDRDVREKVALGLALLYRRGAFDKETNKAILAQVATVNRPRKRVHRDIRKGCFGTLGHDDYYCTIDQGFHVDISP